MYSYIPYLLCLKYLDSQLDQGTRRVSEFFFVWGAPTNADSIPLKLLVNFA